MSITRTNDDRSALAQSVFLTFPDDVIVEIFKFARPEIILSSFSLVCRHFFTINQMDFLWQFKQWQHFPLSKVVVKPDQTALSIFKTSYELGYQNKQEARLFSCVKEGDLEALKSLSVKLTDHFNKKDKSGKNLFGWAILLKKQAVLDYVYELARAGFVSVDGKTVDVKKTDSHGKTLLNWAAHTNQVDEIIPLLTAGADPNQGRTTTGETPLFIAAWKGYLEVVKALLATPCIKVNQATTTGETPLFFAAKNGHLEVAKALLATPCIKVNQATTTGETPLYIAAWKDHLEVVEALLENGADPNQARTSDGATPLYIAAWKGYLEVVKALLKKDAQINQVDFSSTKLLQSLFQNSVIKLTQSDSLKEGIILLKPTGQMSLPNLCVNVSMIFALEKAYQFLTQVRQEAKQTSAIRDLIDLIYTNIDKSFSDHVTEWKVKFNSQDDSMTNQMIISAQESIVSGIAKSIGAPLIGLVGFFSESNAKTLKIKMKTHAEIFIEDLVAHSQLWSENTNIAENTFSASSSSMQQTNSSGQ